jgi:hypothetical protein
MVFVEKRLSININSHYHFQFAATVSARKRFIDPLKGNNSTSQIRLEKFH